MDYKQVMEWRDFTKLEFKMSFGKISHIATALNHYDVIKWKHFPRYCPYVRGIHQSPADSPTKGQYHKRLIFLCCQSKQTAEQILDRPVIRNPITFISCHRNWFLKKRLQPILTSKMSSINPDFVATQQSANDGRHSGCYEWRITYRWLSARLQ